MAHADLVIVGAGWFGLTMARTYSQLHPEAKMMVLDAENSAGGVWASSRLYPGLKTNNLVGSYENPDLPMVEQDFRNEPMLHILGPLVHRYLERFATHFGLKKYIYFQHKVEKVEEQKLGSNGSWKMTVRRLARGTREAEVFELTADNLVIAAGVTAHANLPQISGSDQFDSPMYHAKEFEQRKDFLSTAKRVAVYGAAKSAWDGVYAYATAGVQVEWVMRESGKGPCWMAPAFVDNGKRVEDVAVTRLFTLFQPCIWPQKDGLNWLRWLIHSTWIGMFFARKFWSSF